MSENLSGALKNPQQLNAAVEGNDVYLLTLNRCLQLETISLFQPGRKQTKTRRCTTVRNSDDHAIPLR